MTLLFLKLRKQGGKKSEKANALVDDGGFVNGFCPCGLW
jgi:hypothetical protein